MPGVVHNPVDDGLSADGQQALGPVVGVGARAFALAGNRQNDLHIISFFGIAVALWATAIRGGKCRKIAPNYAKGGSAKQAPPPLARWGVLLTTEKGLA